MDKARFQELQFGPDPQTLSIKEIVAGWRWCNEFDGLLTQSCPMGSDEECLCATDKSLSKKQS